MRQLYVVRHGETQWNTEGRLQGRLDSPLTPRGQAQAAAIGLLLQSEGGAEVLFASPSGRTRETAYLLNSYLRAELFFEDALQEKDVGRWSGEVVLELAERDPAGWAAHQADPHGFRPPGGENMVDMLERVRPLVEGLFVIEADNVVLVTHGIMSRVVLGFYLGLGPGEIARLRHPNDLVYRLTFHADVVEPHYFRCQPDVSGVLVDLPGDRSSQGSNRQEEQQEDQQVEQQSGQQSGHPSHVRPDKTLHHLPHHVPHHLPHNNDAPIPLAQPGLLRKGADETIERFDSSIT